jgi:hypothetical protein
MASLIEPVQTNVFTAKAKSILRGDTIAFIENELASLPKNWDGYGAYLIHPEVVKKSVTMLKSLPETLFAMLTEDNVTPNPSGTISLDWQKETVKVFLEIGSSFSTYFVKENGRLIETNNNFHPDDHAQRIIFIDLLKRYFTV